MLRSCSNPNCSVQFDHRISKCPACGTPPAFASATHASATGADAGISGLDPGSPICPYCGNVMERGAVLGDRYRLKWLPADKPLTLGIWALDGQPIGEGGAFSRPRVDGQSCVSCGKIIVRD
ncbi:MAG: PF20097 family protein [Planctomycetales bacterium]